MRYHVKCNKMAGVVLNTLFSASGYPIAMQICVLDSYETVKKFYNYIKTSNKFERF